MTTNETLRIKLQGFLAEAERSEMEAKAQIKRKGNSVWNVSVARAQLRSARATRMSATAALARLDEIEHATRI